MTMIRVGCKDCQLGQVRDGVIRCKARPPSTGPDGKAAWPIVDPMDYCKEFNYKVEGLEL